MAVNISAIQSATTSALGLSNFVLVSLQNPTGYTPNPKIFPDGTIGPQEKNFLFNYEGENTVTLESDITDHFVEDNTTVQDQIALPPEMISVQGYIGELSDIVPRPLQLAKSAAESLTFVSAYTPGLSASALLAYNQAAQAYQIAKIGVQTGLNAFNSVFGEGGVQTEQQIAFNYFYGYWQQRKLFSVQTPWNLFKNCAIKTLRAVQDPSTRFVTDFDITFKVMRFASVADELTALNFQGRLVAQSSTATGNGSHPLGKEADFSSTFSSNFPSGVA